MSSHVSSLTPGLQPLAEIARIRVVHCSVDPGIARARHIERGLADPRRERFHDDRPVRAAREGRDLPIGDFVALNLDVPTLTVDTSDGYRPALENIVAFASKPE